MKGDIKKQGNDKTEKNKQETSSSWTQTQYGKTTVN